jgi:secreted trypsin-like serine protease
MPGWVTKPQLGFVGLCAAVCLLSSSLPAYAVTGGTEVDAASFVSDWSFTVGVGTAGSVFCTGSLVDSSTVITAAHCVDPALVSPPDTVYYGSRDYTTASTVGIDSIE